MRFGDMTQRAQVHRLRVVALRALERYPIEIRRLRLQEHGFNTTFRVDAADGRIFALRIDVNRRKPASALEAETAWLAAIANDTDIVVPTPQATIDGGLHTSVYFDELDTDLNVAVMSWLPGRDLGSPTVESLHELGRVMALLHRHAARWSVPAGAEFPDLSAVLMDSPDRLRAGHPMISDEQQRVVEAALAHVEPLFDALIAADDLIPIHGDLHGWNVKWLRNRLSVFDFDDAGLGVPAQDLSITAYYQRPDPELRPALLDGYRTVSPLPPFTHDQFEAALASRGLLLLNDVLDINTRQIRDIAPRFLANTVLRMRAYLDAGEYRSDVPGVLPID